jgi:hypothetical protein
MKRKGYVRRLFVVAAFAMLMLFGGNPLEAQVEAQEQSCCGCQCESATTGNLDHWVCVDWGTPGSNPQICIPRGLGGCNWGGGCTYAP